MKLITIIFSILLFLSSCSDNENETINIEGPIIGRWSLIIYDPGYSPIENFSIGKIIWEFKKTGTLSIFIDESISSTPVLPTGKYNYSLNELKITIDNMEYDYDDIDNTKLRIRNKPESDGFRIEFTRLAVNN